MPKVLSILAFLLLFGSIALAQNGLAYLGSFDQRLLHFGIQVGYTQSKFDLTYTEDEDVRELIQGTTSYYAPGFHINVIGDLRINDYLNLRLVPGITLIDRNLSFSWEKGYQATHWKTEDHRNVESVYGEIPLELKFRAMRYKNFRPYVLGGGSFGFDFASLRKNKNNANESIVRLNAVDLRYTTGVGFDIFLRYVKFAIEFKMAFGLLDLKVQDDDVYTRSTDDLFSRTFMLSFTFEGDPFAQ